MFSFLFIAAIALVTLFLILNRISEWLASRANEQAERDFYIRHQKRIIAAHEAMHEARMRRRSPPIDKP